MPKEKKKFSDQDVGKKIFALKTKLLQRDHTSMIFLNLINHYIIIITL